MVNETESLVDREAVSIIHANYNMSSPTQEEDGKEKGGEKSQTLGTDNTNMEVGVPKRKPCHLNGHSRKPSTKVLIEASCDASHKPSPKAKTNKLRERGKSMSTMELDWCQRFLNQLGNQKDAKYFMEPQNQEMLPASQKVYPSTKPYNNDGSWTQQKPIATKYSKF